jgi:tellurite resistance-related uncharacterized protein
MKALPPEAKPYKRTPTFTQDTIPQGLRKNHTTVEGAWAKIVVEEGLLRYTIEGDEPEELMLSPERFGVVEPQVPHHVEPAGKVSFFVEFYR